MGRVHLARQRVCHGPSADRYEGAAGSRIERRQSADAKEDSKDKKDQLKVPASEVIELKLSTVPPASQGTLVFTNARVLTMKGDQVLDDADVVVRGNRIAAVDRGAAATAPPDAK